MKRFLSTWSVLLIVAVSSFIVTSCSSDDDDEVKVENKVGGKVPKVSEAVDLGLSVKWAPWNVGASQPTDYGEWFAWGEVTPGDSEGYRNYKHFSDGAKVSKYYCDDGWKTLEAEDDAATANWGRNWRMPTHDEELELREGETSWEWVKDYNGSGHNGYIIRSLKVGYEDAEIFLPACGYYGEGLNNWNDPNVEVAYWASESVYFNSTIWGWDAYKWQDMCGLPVRAVCP